MNASTSQKARSINYYHLHPPRIQSTNVNKLHAQNFTNILDIVFILHTIYDRYASSTKSLHFNTRHGHKGGLAQIFEIAE